MPVNTPMITSAESLTTAVALAAAAKPVPASAPAPAKAPIFSPVRSCSLACSVPLPPHSPTSILPAVGPTPPLGGLLPPLTKEDFSNLLSPFFNVQARSVADLDRMQAVVRPPTHLLVLVHGLTGHPSDLGYIKRLVEFDADADKRDILVHATDVNTGKTQDGVEAGGIRVALDIEAVVAANPTLEKISLVGFSLGGLYARYAVARLFKAETGMVAGLRPNVMMTVASPHLGVRNFGLYRFAPREIHFLAHLIAGKTGSEMMLRDRSDDQSAPLLERMTRNTDEMPFLDALAAFERRILYANIQNDLMVPLGTAAIDPTTLTLTMDKSWQVPPGSEIIDESYDESGCRVWYQTENIGPVENPNEDEDADPEHGMAGRLRTLPWAMVGVDFQTPIPIAHNRIVALMRNPVEEYFNRPGRRAVAHMISTLVGFRKE